MLHSKESQARTINEPCEVMTFQFSESKKKIRNVFVGEVPHFVGSDICKILGHSNSRKAMRDHCRYVTKSYIPHPQNENKQLEVLVIPESDVYRLVIKSTLPSAQLFEMWIMEEVLPTLRKKGYYAMGKQRQKDFIDARAMPYEERELNGFNIRYINIEGEMWFSVNDIHRAIGSATGSNQSAKKLNAVETLAIKIQLYGNTSPAWFTNSLGFRLLLSGSRVLRDNRQLVLPFQEEGGAK